MTQATTETAYKLLCAAVAESIAIKDWATAYSKYAQVEAVLASFPRSTTGAANNVTVYREEIRNIRTALDAAVKAQKFGDTSRLIRTQMGRALR